MNLEELRRLAGVRTDSPISINNESNISITGNEKAQLMKKHNIKPGTEEWFKLWFARPYMTGEKPVDEQ